MNYYSALSCVIGTLLSTGDIIVKRADRVFVLIKLIVYWGETED